MDFSQRQLNFKNYAPCKASAVGDWARRAWMLSSSLNPTISIFSLLVERVGKNSLTCAEWRADANQRRSHFSLLFFHCRWSKKNPSLSALKTFEIIARPRCHRDFCDHKSQEPRHFFNHISEDSSRNYPDKKWWGIWAASWTLRV